MKELKQCFVYAFCFVCLLFTACASMSKYEPLAGPTVYVLTTVAIDFATSESDRADVVARLSDVATLISSFSNGTLPTIDQFRAALNAKLSNPKWASAINTLTDQYATQYGKAQANGNVALVTQYFKDVSSAILTAIKPFQTVAPSKTSNCITVYLPRV